MSNKQAIQLLHGALNRLTLLGQQLDLHELEEADMAVNPVVAELISQLNAATNSIADRLTQLMDRADNAGSLQAAEIAEVLRPEVQRLQAMGSNPDNPVPAQG